MQIQLDNYRTIEIPESKIYKAYVVESGLFSSPVIISRHKSDNAAINAGIKNPTNTFRWIILDNVAYKPSAFQKYRWHK